MISILSLIQKIFEGMKTIPKKLYRTGAMMFVGAVIFTIVMAGRKEFCDDFTKQERNTGKEMLSDKDNSEELELGYNTLICSIGNDAKDCDKKTNEDYINILSQFGNTNTATLDKSINGEKLVLQKSTQQNVKNEKDNVSKLTKGQASDNEVKEAEEKNKAQKATKKKSQTDVNGTKATETWKTEAKTTETKMTERKTTEVQTTEVQTTEVQTTEAQTTEVQTTEVQEAEAQIVESMESEQTEANNTEEIHLNDSEYYWLLQIVDAEAGDQDELGMIMVANVILNRVRSYKFPNNIIDVIFQNDGVTYQFEPVKNERIYDAVPSASVISAVNRALNGEDYSQGALFFTMRTSDSSWFNTSLEFLFVHGDHYFYTYY